MKIIKISYSRVFSLGSYENEKISMEAEVEEGDDVMKCYVKLKESVEMAHDLRDQLRNYKDAQRILENKMSYTGRQVQNAMATIELFEMDYPNLVTSKEKMLAGGEGKDIPVPTRRDNEEEVYYEHDDEDDDLEF